MKRRVEEMEDEEAKLSKLQQQVDKQISSAADSVDENSMYVRHITCSSATVLCLKVSSFVS